MAPGKTMYFVAAAVIAVVTVGVLMWASAPPVASTSSKKKSKKKKKRKKKPRAPPPREVREVMGLNSEVVLTQSGRVGTIMDDLGNGRWRVCEHSTSEIFECDGPGPRARVRRRKT